MSLQEKLQMSGNVTFVGVMVVFMILILLILVISISSRIIKFMQNTPVSDNMDATDQDYRADDEESSCVDAYHANMDEGVEVSSEIVEVIMAAISASLEPGSGFRLRSIRRANNHVTAWNRSGRNEYLATRL